MEYCAGGNLKEYLEKRNFNLSEQHAKELTYQLVTALQYIHSYGIVHRDLKPENILMTNNTDKAHIRISDFGLARIIGHFETCKDSFGTLGFAAPEVLERKPNGQEADLWSLGIIIYFLLSGTIPFNAIDDKEMIR